MESLHFSLQAKWNGDRLGYGQLKTEGLNSIVSVPRELGGPGMGTNPEELLISSAANCYLITLAAVLSNRQLPVQSIEMESQGTVVKAGNRLQFKQIIHRPVITLQDADEGQLELAEKGAHRAETACMISQALKGNVEVLVKPVVRNA